MAAADSYAGLSDHTRRGHRNTRARRAYPDDLRQLMILHKYAQASEDFDLPPREHHAFPLLELP